MTFAETTLHYVQPGSRVLDLGAGNGWFARQAVERGAVVTAVDLKDAPQELSGLRWIKQDVVSFVANWPTQESYDIIFSRNLIQFLSGEWVKKSFFPTALQHLDPHGIFALQTFFQDPEPSFERPLISRYTAEALQENLSSLKITHLRQFNENAPDMKGIPRTFFITNCIAQKSNN